MMYTCLMQILSVRSRGKYSLDELLSQINSENLREEVDFGEPVGKEVW